MPKRPPTPPSFSPPLPPNQHLVHLLSPQGSNNWLCQDTEGTERLVVVASKLRRIKSLIIMRGDFAVVSIFPSGPDDKGGRLVGEIIHVLNKGDIKDWKKAGAWPEGFGETPVPATADQVDQQSNSENEDDDEAEEDEEDKQ